MWGAPDTGARDQYMPDEGAAGTSGAVLGSWRGGKGTWGPRGRGAADALRDPPEAPDPVLAVVARPAMADVERIATGRRPSSRLDDPTGGSDGMGVV